AALGSAQVRDPVACAAPTTWAAVATSAATTRRILTLREDAHRRPDGGTRLRGSAGPGREHGPRHGEGGPPPRRRAGRAAIRERGAPGRAPGPARRAQGDQPAAGSPGRRHPPRHCGDGEDERGACPPAARPRVTRRLLPAPRGAAGATRVRAALLHARPPGTGTHPGGPAPGDVPGGVRR